MSSERDDIYYFLTASGWLSASSGELDQAPSDWLRLYVVHVYQGSPFGPTSRHFELQETRQGTSEAIAEEIEARFPRPDASKISPEDLNALLDRIRIK